MADGHTLILSSDYQRMQAKRLIDAAPHRAVVNVRPARRTNDQNALLWAMLSQISRAKPEGRSMPPETWKCLFMMAAGFQCTFEPGLDGQGVVPMGFRSSRLTKVQFSDLIECIHEYAPRHSIPLSDETPRINWKLVAHSQPSSSWRSSISAVGSPRQPLASRSSVNTSSGS